ncbi:hypothetical protein [Frigoribacterium sp. CG_9.8]|uniref:hypothetical protein n=1 Tax=Frigoribacterium sp. CG_9.8 TaxID=2787733 RepID=UPI0018CA44AB|nr:hypothetical protein [Frigoribacterium sp. CG_9.8]MBG6107399.1 hypothetical protein [Frigoribacterium sp. CG_9.8]
MAGSSKSYRRWGGMIIAVAAIASPLVPVSSASAAVPTSWVDEQVNFILSEQLSSGAILSVGGAKITPYFANIAALGLIKAGTPAARAGALKWMRWYLNHLNAAATNVPANSVFDYSYDPGTQTETPTGDFDSVDSYASTTLNLAYAAYSSGDPALQSFVTANILTYEAIANILNFGAPVGVRIQSGPDAGLTIAKPSYAIAYTMDNAEVYSGLAEFALLESALGRGSEATYYGGWASSTKDTILAKLWNPTNQNWDWAYGNMSNTNVFYAQATAQLWPTLYGVVAPNDPKAISAWTQFSASYPAWFNGSIPDGYPWVSVSRAAQMMGETANADSYLTNVHSRYAPGFTLPTTCAVAVCGRWYDNEAGWFILASASSNAKRSANTKKSREPIEHPKKLARVES